MNTIYFILGISGLGKSTRVHWLKRFLDTLEVAKPCLSLSKKAIGFYYPKANISIIGREGSRGFQGIDSFSTLFSSVDMFKELYLLGEKSSIVVEGAGRLSSPMLLPETTAELPLKIHALFFEYATYDQYLARLQLRGSKGKGLTMWRKQKYNVSLKERFAAQLSKNSKASLSVASFDSELSSVGEIVLLPRSLLAFKQFIQQESRQKEGRTLSQEGLF